MFFLLKRTFCLCHFRASSTENKKPGQVHEGGEGRRGGPVPHQAVSAMERTDCGDRGATMGGWGWGVGGVLLSQVETVVGVQVYYVVCMADMGRVEWKAGAGQEERSVT